MNIFKLKNITIFKMKSMVVEYTFEVWENNYFWTDVTFSTGKR